MANMRLLHVIAPRAASEVTVAWKLPGWEQHEIAIQQRRLKKKQEDQAAAKAERQSEKKKQAAKQQARDTANAATGSSTPVASTSSTPNRTPAGGSGGKGCGWSAQEDKLLAKLVRQDGSGPSTSAYSFEHTMLPLLSVRWPWTKLLPRVWMTNSNVWAWHRWMGGQVGPIRGEIVECPAPSLEQN